MRFNASYQDMLAGFGASAQARRPAKTPEEVAIEEELAELVAEGASSDGLVRISLHGGSTLSVAIAPGTVDAVREWEFSPRAQEAVTALIQDQVAKSREVRSRIKGTVHQGSETR